MCGCLPTIPKCFQPVRNWSGWSKVSSLISGRTGTKTSQFSMSKGTNDNSIMATKSWHVLHSNEGNSKTFRSASTESTERLELGKLNGSRGVYVSSGEAQYDSRR